MRARSWRPCLGRAITLDVIAWLRIRNTVFPPRIPSEVVAAEETGVHESRLAHRGSLEMAENILLGPLVLFAAALCLTPGPNVVMVTASVANFGFRRAIPQMLGITLGFGFMVVAG